MEGFCLGIFSGLRNARLLAIARYLTARNTCLLFKNQAWNEVEGDFVERHVEGLTHDTYPQGKLGKSVLLLQYRVVRNEMEDGFKKRTSISNCTLFNRKEN